MRSRLISSTSDRDRYDLQDVNMKSLHNKLIRIISILFILISIPVYISWHKGRPLSFEAYIIPLRYSQAVFVNTRAGKTILVDGGSTRAIIKELGHILPFYIKNIDIVLVTKTEKNNVLGLIDVLERYQVRELFVPAITLQNLGLSTSTDSTYETLLTTAKRRGVPVRTVIAGDQIVLDGDTHLDILFPVSKEEFSYSRASAPEVLYRLIHASSSIVSLGSATPKIQKYIVNILKGQKEESYSPFRDCTDASSALIYKVLTNNENNDKAKHSYLNCNKTSALIISKSFIRDNLPPQIMDYFTPKFIVYSKAVSNTSLVSKTNKKEPSSGPAEINIRERGVIRFLYNASVTEGTESAFFLNGTNTASRDGE